MPIFRRSGRASACLAQTLRKRLALQIRQHQKIVSVLMANIVQGANVRMIESRDGAGFLELRSPAGNDLHGCTEFSYKDK